MVKSSGRRRDVYSGSKGQLIKTFLSKSPETDGGISSQAPMAGKCVYPVKDEGLELAQTSVLLSHPSYAHKSLRPEISRPPLPTSLRLPYYQNALTHAPHRPSSHSSHH